MAVGIVAATLSAALPRIYAAGEFEGPSPTTATCSHRKTGQLALGGPPSSCQRGDYATDNLLAQEQPEMADTIEHDGFHLGVRWHRTQPGHDDVE